MDIQKGREAFEILQNQKIFKWFEFDSNLNAYVLKDISATFEKLTALAELNYGWDMWQEAKAKAVPASINDIQSWIAVNSFSALDAADDNVPIVDANELAKYIDSLSLGVSVPEGYVVLRISDVREILSNASDAMCDEAVSIVFSETGIPSTWYDHHYVAEKNIIDAIEAQEQTNDK